MRTTVELPPDLMRAAKARAAERGEPLKRLFMRAVTRELERVVRPARHEPVAWPLIVSRQKHTVRVTNDDLARSDAETDVAHARRAMRRRR